VRGEWKAPTKMVTGQDESIESGMTAVWRQRVEVEKPPSPHSDVRGHDESMTFGDCADQSGGRCGEEKA